MTVIPRSEDGLPNVPIDADYLRKQGADFGADPTAFYLNHGLKHKLNPTPWFFTDWYAWQNPDWTRYASPYLHYLEMGCDQGRDPSPFVDIPRYRQITDVPNGAIYDLILAGHRSVALGIYDSRADLELCQRHFKDAIEVVAHHKLQPARRKKALVVLQAGRGAVTQDWFDGKDRDWDLLVNYYDSTGFRPGLGDYVFFQKGTKFTSMWVFWNRYRRILTHYDHVLFLDDDVEVSCVCLNRLFEACRTHELDLAQMSLSPGSSCNWQELFSRPNSTSPRAVSAVEIMMPVFSAAALRKVAQTFAQSVSGFGLDLAWGKIIRDSGGKIAVLDDVVATHARPVDQTDGAYYSYLRRHLINAKAELWTLMNDYDADRNLVTF